MREAGAEPERLRLDLWLVRNRGISRSAAQVLIEAGAVRINDKPGRPSRLVGESDVVTVEEPAPAIPAEAAGPGVDLEIVDEDEYLAVINKPAGMVVHPAPGHPHGTLADGLRQRGTTWSLLGGAERPGIVHRLDRDTSGLLVVAKTEAAHRALAGQLADRSLGRIYWALVHGGFAETTGTIDAPIGRDPRERKRMAVVDSGREAVTDFRVLERLPRTTVLEVSLRTGRTHQIRVHLSHIGHPIVGDTLYHGRRDGVPRPALHASELHFIHPGDGQLRRYHADLPHDLREVLDAAREGRL